MPLADPNSSTAIFLATRLAAAYGSLPQVEAVAHAGSRTSRFHDAASDIDLYVYVSSPVTLEARAEIAGAAEVAEIGNERWEPGDEWVDRESGLSVDVMFRHTCWMEERIDRVLKEHQASVGYSTCFWYNVLSSNVLFDRAGWLRGVQEICRTAYPEELKRAIIAKNFPVLRDTRSSYLHQIELAISRKDWVSVNHRVAGLLASYFDVLFAINELPHPGEKRLVQYAKTVCRKIPQGAGEDISKLIATAGIADGSVVARCRKLVEGLEDLLREENLLPPAAGIVLSRGVKKSGNRRLAD